MNISQAQWRTSTRSGGNGNCVEVATNFSEVVAVRDTKDQGQGPILTFGTAEWQAFIGTIKCGDFDLPA